MSITAKLEGADNLLTKMRAYATGSSQRVQEVVLVTLLQIESDAKRLAPVDTGLLRSSIHANLTGKFGGSVSVNAEYAVWVEFGNGRNKPQPFIYPAIHGNKAAFLANLKKALKFRI